MVAGLAGRAWWGLGELVNEARDCQHFSYFPGNTSIRAELGLSAPGGLTSRRSTSVFSQ